MKDGQYYYAPHRSQWGVWQRHKLSGGAVTGTFLRDFPTKEEARQEVYKLNKWIKA